MNKLLYNFNTVLYQFLETGTTDKTFMGHDQELRWLAFNQYPLSFFLNSPFKPSTDKECRTYLYYTHSHFIEFNGFRVFTRNVGDLVNRNVYLELQVNIIEHYYKKNHNIINDVNLHLPKPSKYCFHDLLVNGL